MEGKVASDIAVRYEGRMHMRATKPDSITSSFESSPNPREWVDDFGEVTLNTSADKHLFSTAQSSSFVGSVSNNGQYDNAIHDDSDSCSEEVGTPIVRHTFIECHIRARPVRRRKTLPASWRVVQEPPRMSYNEDSSCFGTCRAATDSWAFTESRRVEQAGDMADIECASDGDSSFHESFAEEVTARKSTIAEQFAEIIQEASNSLEVSDLLESVETSCGPHGCVILLRPCGATGTSTKEILALAQQSLRDAAIESKVAYILGYCSPSMAASSPLGFEITLGAMKNAKLACWHLFKKGICRHGAKCRWQHPSCKLPVRVIVEVAELEAPIACIHDFKLHVAKAVNSIASALQRDQSVSHASACEDKRSKGWTIAVSPSCPGETDDEELIALAKTAVIGTMVGAQVALMGCEAQPFVPRARGFTIVLGNKKTAHKPCRNMYYWGVCQRGCSCTYGHPVCLVPIQVVIKTE